MAADMGALLGGLPRDFDKLAARLRLPPPPREITDLLIAVDHRFNHVHLEMYVTF